MTAHIELPHPSTYMKEVFETAIENNYITINFAEDELEYCLECINKAEKFDKISNIVKE